MIFNIYVAIWIFFIPISSVVVFPDVKGTLPAYLFSFFTMIIMFFREKRKEYFYIILKFFFFFFVFILLSQLGILLKSISLEELYLINPKDSDVLFRKGMLTQSVYLFMGIITFSFFKVYYREKMDDYIFRAGVFFAAYGIYEVIYFSLFNQNGDFLSNRIYQDGRGYLFQVMTISGITFERLKSLTSEPSQFAFTILPFLIYAVHKGKKLISFIFFISLLLSTSTTGFVGLITYIFIRIYYYGIKDRYIISVFVLIGVMSIKFFDVFWGIYENLIFSKILMETSSGLERGITLMNHLNYYKDLSFLNQLFGIGFGYIRSFDFFSTLLVNVGIVGLMCFSLFFLYPVFKLKSTDEVIGLKIILVIIYITMMISVSEFSFLSMWMFLGISYKEVEKQIRCSNK